MMPKSSAVWAVGGLAAGGALACIAMTFARVPPFYPSDYLSQLGLVVTIMASVTGLFSIGGVLVSYRALGLAGEIEKEQAHVRAKASVAVRGMAEAEGKAREYLASVRNCAGAFQPSGERLSDAIRAVSTSPAVAASPEGVAFRAVLSDLARAFEANAEFGAQVQKLFVGDTPEVMASALFLSQQAPLYARPLIEERAELERKKAAPDLDLLLFIMHLSGKLDRA